MSDAKWKENIPGEYYVEESCIAAKFCVATAPNNFKMSSSGHAYVYKQPQTPEEKEQCHEALMGCPVKAVHDDGAQ